MEIKGARVLAFGTAGAQGSGLVEQITSRGGTALRATTHPERARAWALAGDAAVVADLTDPASVQAAAEDVSAAVLHVPLGLGSPEGGAAVLASIRALRAAGLAVAVNLGSPVPPAGVPDPFGVRPMAEAVVAAGAVALTPTAYLENHAAPWALGPITVGELVYPRPPGDVLAWIAAGDVTAAAVAALAKDVRGELIALAGAAPLTFDALAVEMGAGIDRPLAFRRVSASEYADLLRPVVGEDAARGVATAYAAMPEEPNPLMAVDASAAWGRLGLTPTTARDWAATVLAPALSGARVG